MPDSFDIPDIPDVEGGGGGSGGGGGKGGGGSSRRRWPWLAAGLLLGIAGTLLLPPVLAPHLPSPLRSDGLRIGGEVLKKRSEADRLLLTVETDSGAMLATFRRRVSAIDLLVEPGDSVTLVLERYRPFVEDPGLRGVRKDRGARGRASSRQPGDVTEGPGGTDRPAPAVDSAASDTAAGSGAPGGPAAGRSRPDSTSDAEDGSDGSR